MHKQSRPEERAACLGPASNAVGAYLPRMPDLVAVAVLEDHLVVARRHVDLGLGKEGDGGQLVSGSSVGHLDVVLRGIGAALAEEERRGRIMPRAMLAW